MRRIRSLLVEIYPPNLGRRGSRLRSATSSRRSRAWDRDDARRRRRARPRRGDGAARLPRRRRGDPERRAPRACDARRRCALSPRTAGRGWRWWTTASASTQSDRERSRAEGHVGLSLLEELAARRADVEVRLDARARDDVRPGGAGRMIRVVIADDHGVVRAGLAQLLATFEDVELVGAAAERRGGRRRSRRARSRRRADGSRDAGARRHRGDEADQAAQPDVAVVVLTSFSDRDRILRALDAGAAGYLLKDAEPDELARAIGAAARGEAPLDPKAARALLSARRAASARRGALRRASARCSRWSRRACRTS